MPKMSRRSRSATGATELAQFPLALYCMFIVLLLPLLNLIAVLIAGGTVYLATNDLVAKAATQPTFTQALNAMAVEAYTFQSNTLAKFVKMMPQGGYTGCGNDLFMLATDVGGTGVQTSSPDQPLTASLNTTNNIYEMQVVSTYSVAPLIDMSALPILGVVPGLGRPIQFSFAASRPIEHPGGMNTAQNAGSGTGVTPFARIAATNPGTSSGGTASGGWRTPDIYQQIAAAGQTVVSQNVFLVPATSPWVSSGLNISPGENVWMDTTAVGTWSITSNSGFVMIDANGFGTQYVSYWGSWSSAVTSYGCLVGAVGVPPNSDWSSPPTLHPNIFQVGNQLLDYRLNGTGPLVFQINDTPGMQFDDQGAQMVRIIVTR